MHERKDIRDAIVAALVAAGASFGSRVFPSRNPPLRTAELPAVCVYTDDEAVDRASWSTAPRELTRTVNVAVEAWARATDDIEDVLDALALEVETAMDADLNLDDTAFDSGLLSTEIGIASAGDRPMGAARLIYSVVYHTELRAPPVEDAFDVADIHYDLSGEQHADDQAHDTLTGINEE